MTKFRFKKCNKKNSSLVYRFLRFVGTGNLILTFLENPILQLLLIDCGRC